MTSKVYDLSEVSETLTLTQDGCECQAAQDERDYPPQIASLLHLSLQKHAENDTSVPSGRRRRAPAMAAAREVAARGPNPVGSQLGQLVLLSSPTGADGSNTCSVSEAEHAECCQHLRLLVWKTLLIPEVIFTGHFTRGGEGISTAGCARSAGISPSDIYLPRFAASL